MFFKSRKGAAALALVTSLFCETAAAGSQTGQLVYVRVRSTDGLIIVEMNGPVSNKPSCAGLAYWMIEDEKSNAGKQQLALLMAAHASGQTVTIDGTGTCSRWPDGETIAMVTVHPK